MIFYIDTYYDDIYDLLGKLMDYEDDDEAKEDLAMNYPDGITVRDCKEAPLLDVTKDRIFSALWDAVNEDYWPEDSDGVEHELEKALNAFLDVIPEQIEVLKKAMPTVWMATKEKTHYSLKELEGML